MEYKSNFDFIKDEWSDIYNVCENTELYFVKEDYNTSMIKSRQASEEILKFILIKENTSNEILRQINNLQYKRIDHLLSKGIIDKYVCAKLKTVKNEGNDAVHKLAKSKINAKIALESLYEICIWFEKKYGSKKDFRYSKFNIDEIMKIDIESKINENEIKFKDYDDKLEKMTENLNRIMKMVEGKEFQNKQVNTETITAESISPTLTSTKEFKVG